MLSITSRTWGRKAAKLWWQDAQQQSARRLDDGTVMCHPVTHLMWFEEPGASRRSGICGANLGGEMPYALAVAGTINSAARLVAARGLQWERVLALADGADGMAEEGPPIEAIQRKCGRWQVADMRSLERVVAHALRDKHVRVRLLSPEPYRLREQQPGVTLDHTYLYFQDNDVLVPSALTVDDGWCSWQEETREGRLSPGVIMLSRATEPIIWPKAWHFRCKMASMSDEANDHCFGAVPVRWVPVARRWATGNRHRLVASLLLGRDLLVHVRSGSARPQLHES